MFRRFDGRGPLRLGQLGGVADRFDLSDELVSRDRTVNRYGRPLGRVVDSGLDPVELIEPLADTRRA